MILIMTSNLYIPVKTQMNQYMFYLPAHKSLLAIGIFTLFRVRMAVSRLDCFLLFIESCCFIVGFPLCSL